MAALPDGLRRAAQEQARLLNAGEVRAHHVPMHGDLWKGNILRQHDGSLALIDWAGSEVQGYAMYGLIRAAISLGVSRRRLAVEIEWHRQALGGSRHLPELHLLGALGHYARHLGEFPPDRFATSAQECYAVFLSAQA